MYSKKILLAAAVLAVAAGTSAASAAPWDNRIEHRGDFRPVMHHEIYRPLIARERIYDVLRVHHYRGLGQPIFLRGHYVLHVVNRFGRTVLVEVDPYTGAFIGEFRA